MLIPVNENNEEERINKLKEEILQKYLTKEARERLSRVRLAHKDLAESVENFIVQQAISGKLKEPLSDEDLRKILEILTRGEDRDVNIRVQRKGEI